MKKFILSFMMICLFSFDIVMAAPHGNPGFGPVTGGSPPGLKNKGMPPGLKMQNKTPEGWSHGEKKKMEIIRCMLTLDG